MRPLDRPMPVVLAGALVLALALACGPRPPRQDPLPPPPRPEDFSAERAFEHLTHLVQLGPRAAGTEGGAAARSYIVEQLRALDAEVNEQLLDATLDDGTVLRLVNVVATVRGEVPDLFVLATPYDTAYIEEYPFVGANESASGTALLLELARVFTVRPLHYTVRLAFLDGEAPLGRGGERDAATRRIGGRALAESWAADGLLPRIRALVYFQRVGDADLRIARDLFSHRTFREVFWTTARRLGHGDVFSAASAYESPNVGHRSFLEVGVRRVILIADTAFGGEEPPGLYAGTADDTIERCAPESLGTVGEVTVAALEEISERLAKIDRFADAPLSEPVAPRSGEQADAAPEDAEAPGPPPPSAGTEAADDAQEPAPQPREPDALPASGEAQQEAGQGDPP